MVDESSEVALPRASFSGGAQAVRRYLFRLLLWRYPPAWYAFLIFGIPLLLFGGSALKGNLFEVEFPFSSFQPLFLALAVTMVIGPVEEFGWRGLAQPLLQQRFAPIWGVWHLPAFLLIYCLS